MYLHLGKNTTVLTKDIIGVFDIDATTVNKDAREYLNRAQRDGVLVDASEGELPKSFTVTGEAGQRVYLGQMNSQTIQKRLYRLEREQRPLKMNNE